MAELLPTKAPTASAAFVPGTPYPSSFSLMERYPLHRTLTTGYRFPDEKFSFGNMFDISALAPLVIRSFSLHSEDAPRPEFAAAEVILEIWTKGGSFTAGPADADQWTKICHTLMPRGTAGGQATEMDPSKFNDVVVQADTTQSFLVMLSSPNMILSPPPPNSPQGENAVYSSNGDMELHVGRGVGRTPFDFESAKHFEDLFKHRIWHGSVNYCVEQTPSPTQLPSASPSIIPSAVKTVAVFEQTLGMNGATRKMDEDEMETFATAYSEAIEEEYRRENSGVVGLKVTTTVIGQTLSEDDGGWRRRHDRVLEESTKSLTLELEVEIAYESSDVPEEEIAEDVFTQEENRKAVVTAVQDIFGGESGFATVTDFVIISETAKPSAAPTYAPFLDVKPVYSQQKITLAGISRRQRRMLQGCPEDEDNGEPSKKKKKKKKKGAMANPRALSAFEDACKIFLRGMVSKGDTPMNIKDVTVSPDVGDCADEKTRTLNTGGRRLLPFAMSWLDGLAGDRSLQEDTEGPESLDMYTTIRADYKPPPFIDFTEFVEESYEKEGDTFVKELKNADPITFEKVEGVETVSLSFPLPPTNPPTASPTSAAPTAIAMETGPKMDMMLLAAAGTGAAGFAVLACLAGLAFLLVRRRRRRGEVQRRLLVGPGVDGELGGDDFSSRYDAEKRVSIGTVEDSLADDGPGPATALAAALETVARRSIVNSSATNGVSDEGVKVGPGTWGPGWKRDSSSTIDSYRRRSSCGASDETNEGGGNGKGNVAGGRLAPKSSQLPPGGVGSVRFSRGGSGSTCLPAHPATDGMDNDHRESGRMKSTAGGGSSTHLGDSTSTLERGLSAAERTQYNQDEGKKIACFEGEEYMRPSAARKIGVVGEAVRSPSQYSHVEGNVIKFGSEMQRTGSLQMQSSWEKKETADIRDRNGGIEVFPSASQHSDSVPVPEAAAVAMARLRRQRSNKSVRTRDGIAYGSLSYEVISDSDGDSSLEESRNKGEALASEVPHGPATERQDIEGEAQPFARSDNHVLPEVETIGSHDDNDYRSNSSSQVPSGSHTSETGIMNDFSDVNDHVWQGQ